MRISQTIVTAQENPMSPTDRTLAERVKEALSRDEDAAVLEYEGRWRRWGELRRVADQLARLIAASGAGENAPIAFAPRNRPSAVAAELGMIAQGRTIQMIYAFQSPKGLASDIVSLQPGLVVLMEEDVSDEVLDALKANDVAAIILGDMVATAAPGLETTRRRDSAGHGPPRIDILTSGTTGPPKRFSISHDVILKLVTASPVIGAQGAGPSAPPPMPMFMPLGNISGIYTSLPPLLNGVRVVLFDRFTLEEWRQYVVRYRPHYAGIPPSFFQALLDSDIAPEDLSSIRAMGAGAAPLDPAVQRAFEEKHHIPVLVSYGATEFGGPVTSMTLEDRARWGAEKLGSVGRAFAGAKLRVVDPDTKKVLPPGAEGLLEAVSPRIGPDWIRTADIAVIDEDGFVFLRGRADGAIMRGGFKILPETVEQALLEHPAIAAACVVGIEDKRLGQVPAAALQLRPGAAKPDLLELERFLRERVYKTHIPAKWRFVDSLPLTASAKISRPAVLKLFD
jgi:acyl-coenzyme A synthetase/AMP-(fatty) acid ligase